MIRLGWVDVALDAIGSVIVILCTYIVMVLSGLHFHPLVAIVETLIIFLVIRLLFLRYRNRAVYKQKRKAKRDAERLALYRDWPPDLVDRFLAWENMRELDPRYCWPAPPGYVHWKHGDVGRPMTYAEHLARPREGVQIIRRYR